MAEYRRTFLVHRSLWPASSHTYVSARRKAMKFADLPSDDAHKQPSPETCAHFNAMNHREAA